MADFAKRSEVTIETMGKVHNPTGAGVRATSTQVQAKVAKQRAAAAAAPTDSADAADPLATRDTTVGSSKRNIVRKKTADRDSGNYNSTHKKQGGHGKGLWKTEQEEEIYMAKNTDLEAIDSNDPLYMVSEDVDQYILTSHHDATSLRGHDPATQKAVYGPLLTLSEFKLQVTECVKEYLCDSFDADEVIRTLLELASPEYHAHVVKRSISLSMDMGPREREGASRLLTCLHPVPLSMKDMEEGFQLLLDGVDDLLTDVPDAVNMAACFLARAVVDEVLPPAFLSQENNNRPNDPVIARAITLLNREHSTARLEKIWGPGDGRPVEELKQDMDQLLLEYLASRELDEAARCVKELDAKHFHHELIKRGVMCAMEKDGCNNHVENGNGGAESLSNLDAMAALFGFLVRNAIVSDNQVNKGVSRLHKLLDDIKLDVPTAPALLEAFEKMAVEQECLPKNAVTNGKRAETSGIGTAEA